MKKKPSLFTIFCITYFQLFFCLPLSFSRLLKDTKMKLILDSSSDESAEEKKEASLLLICKWGGELTSSGRQQAEELGKVFRCMYPGGQGKSYKKC